ncbi:MAG: D-glycero-beta-D-manno-heptose 1-phosphate adenylyltransferase [Ignavibacteriaceae bacterium]|nr:D-glycero-beta-D-manno-heptose 1-phosphate adenylyltransferase [Ignavibacteriaceae bacterium]
MKYSFESISEQINSLKANGKRIVFTNGVFDILHAGHVDYLNKARELGDILIVGLNSDSSVKRIKGEKRPLVNEIERAFIISNLKAVNFVCIFNEDTPFNLISAIIPDILVKGGDWTIENIVGKDVVEGNGGKVLNIPFVNFQSTTSIVKTVLERYCIDKRE